MIGVVRECENCRGEVGGMRMISVVRCVRISAVRVCDCKKVKGCANYRGKKSVVCAEGGVRIIVMRDVE